MDICDQATETEEYFMSLALSEHRNNRYVLASIGRCHYCDEQIAAGERFCDAECRDDYEHEQKRREMHGY
jgi:hypothetical protein